jgi:hypothetical protein
MTSSNIDNDLVKGVRESVVHNQNLISSGSVQKQVDNINQQGLDLLANIL